MFIHVTRIDVIFRLFILQAQLKWIMLPFVCIQFILCPSLLNWLRGEAKNVTWIPICEFQESNSLASSSIFCLLINPVLKEYLFLLKTFGSLLSVCRRPEMFWISTKPNQTLTIEIKANRCLPHLLPIRLHTRQTNFIAWNTSIWMLHINIEEDKLANAPCQCLIRAVKEFHYTAKLFIEENFRGKWCLKLKQDSVFNIHVHFLSCSWRDWIPLFSDTLHSN